LTKPRKQNGCITVSQDRWILRWREGAGKKRKLRFKTLGAVLPEHRRTKDRKTGKLRVPDDIQEAADRVLEPINAGAASVLVTIGDVVGEVEDGEVTSGEYFREAQKSLKPSTFYQYGAIWKRYLRPRVADRVILDFQRKDAFALWRDIHEDNPKLSRQTMQHVRFVLSAVFEFCLNRGLYSGENPCKADLPAGLAPRKKGPAYTADEINRLLELFISPMAQALIALGFGSALRKGELAALKWEDYEPQKEGGAVIHVRRSVWQGHVGKPKTEGSADDVNIGPEIAAYVEAYRKFCGDVKVGWVFPGVGDQPINLDSFARWQIIPVLSRCMTCKKAKHLHRRADHEYQRDVTMPLWKGFHGFRRAAAGYVARQSVAADGIDLARVHLRKSDSQNTETSYVQTSKQERRDIGAKKEAATSAKKLAAAAIISAGVRHTPRIN
jgi:integrase